MARSKGGPGLIGLIVFIVLCLVLILGYVPLGMGYAKRGQTIDALNAAIKGQLEDRALPDNATLGGALGIRAQARVSTSDAAYDAAFLQKIGDKAADGVKFQELLAVTGWQGENPVGSIKDELSKTTPRQESLLAYIQLLNKNWKDAENQKNTTQQYLTQAVADRDKYLRQLNEANKRLTDKTKEADKQLGEARKKYNDDLAQMQKLTDKYKQDAETAWSERTGEFDKRTKETAELQTQIQRSNQDVLTLKEELQRKKPKQVAITEGRILQADLVQGFAIINLGKRDSIGNGEKFTVMSVGKGGKRAPKGELQIVRVDELVSRADILSQSLENPIVQSDVVEREKKFEESAE